MTKDDESPGVNRVAYKEEALAEAERRVADQVAAFISVRGGPDRAAWIETYFDIGAMYPTDQPDRAIIEDIVGRELNRDFSAQFLCPACGRLAVFDAPSGRWVFFLPETGTNTPAARNAEA